MINNTDVNIVNNSTLISLYEEMEIQIPTRPIDGDYIIDVEMIGWGPQPRIFVK